MFGLLQNRQVRGYYHRARTRRPIRDNGPAAALVRIPTRIWLAPGLARKEVSEGLATAPGRDGRLARRITHQGVMRVGLLSSPCNTRVAARQHTLAVDELSTRRG